MVTNDPKALLRRLLEEPSETGWLEFKHNNNDPDEIARCVSACANAAMLLEKERAFIIFGIENKTKKRLGTAVRLHETKKGNENLANWLSHMITPRLMMEFLDFEDDGKQFAILSVEPTYNQPVSYAKIEYIRIGENIKQLKDFPEHERALWHATGRRTFENAIAVPHQSAEQIFEKLDIDSYYSLIREEKPKNLGEILRNLIARGFVREDLEGGYDITNLGAILFAQDISIFPSVATKSVRVVKYVGKDKQKSEREIEGKRGYAVGFTGLITFILNHLPSEEKYRKGIRVLEPTYPQIAIREIIANALIHQDFMIKGAGPMIEIYEDRLEVINPGNSLIAIDRIIDERRSRNEKLAGVMRTLGMCEERGGGIDKAILEIEEMFLPAPEFFPSQDSMRVVIFGPKKFNDLSKADKTWACFCHCVVRWLRNDYMNNTSLRKRFSLSDDEYQAVSDVIANARKGGRIVKADLNQGNKYAKYVPYWAR